MAENPQLIFSRPTQQEINNALWKACDTFRGVVDPSDYKNYILVFFFLKYLSDVWADHYEEYRVRFGDDEERLRRRMERERFVLPAGSSFADIARQRNAPDLGEIINRALYAIEEKNKQKLEGVFRNVDYNSEVNLGSAAERNRRLRHLIDDFSDPKLDFRPSVIGAEDIVGNAYMYLISMFAGDAGKKGGEFYTPGEVSRLLARLIKPKPGHRIYDPAIGSGSLAIAVAEEVGSRDFQIYGQENNAATWALCRMNMFIHGMDSARIERGNTLTEPAHVEGAAVMKFDDVVANPPFSLDKWGAEGAAADRFNRFRRGVPPKSKGDFAFISHMVESAVEGTGKVGVIVPHGVLFRGSSEGTIRKALIEENLLEGVIGLPSGLFYGTGIPAAILLFNKGKQTTDVLFIDASREYEEGKRQNKLRDADLEKIVSTFERFADVEKYAHRATLEEIRENDYNLNIPRYVNTFEEEEQIDVTAVQREIDDLEIELADVRREMKKYLDELGMGR